MTDFLKDVQPDPSAGNDDPTLEGDPNATPDPQPEQGEGGEGADGKPEGDGRTIDNVYRELSRKQEEFQNRMLEQQNKLIEALNRRPEPAPEKKTGNSLDDMTIQELETARATVAEQNPEQLSGFDAYVNQRRVDEQVNSRMSAWEQRQQTEQLRSKAQQDALRRYPELGERGSEFYNAVNSRLNELGDSYVGANPRAVLDAANDVAAELGVSPRQAGKAAQMRGRVANKANANPKAKETEKQEGLSDAEQAKIAARLKGAMPKGKEFDPKAIREREKFYRDNSQYYLRG